LLLDLQTKTINSYRLNKKLDFNSKRPQISYNSLKRKIKFSKPDITYKEYYRYTYESLLVKINISIDSLQELLARGNSKFTIYPNSGIQLNEWLILQPYLSPILNRIDQIQRSQRVGATRYKNIGGKIYIKPNLYKLIYTGMIS